MAPDPVRASDLTDLTSAVDHVLAALDDLAALGEEVEDEWQYVQDLAASWRERLEAVVASHGHEPLSPATAAAAGRLAGEARQIRDPHRAIDWLSTLPQALLVAIGERP